MKRRLLTVGMDVLVILAVLLALHVAIRYFGALSHAPIGGAFLIASKHVVPRLGFADVRSLYGGVFDANAALMVIILLVVEWALSVVRDRL